MTQEVTMLSRTFHRFAPDGPQREGKRSRTSCVLARLLAVTLAALIALPLAEATQPVAASKDEKFKIARASCRERV